MAKKISLLLAILLVSAVFLISIPTISNAADIKATQIVTGYGDGDIYYRIEGLSLETTKEYQWALESTKNATISNWYDVTSPDYANGTIKVLFDSNNTHLKSVLQASDTGYFALREKDATANILSDYEVDLTLPLLNAFNVKNYVGADTYIISGPYTIKKGDIKYQWEKITDSTIINGYVDNKGDLSGLNLKGRESFPSYTDTNWMKGYTLLQYNNTAPKEDGLYYLWIIADNATTKTIYGQAVITIGEVTKVADSGSSSGSGSGSGSQSRSTSGSSNGTTGSSNSSSTGKTDPTVATTILPKTGISVLLGTTIVATIGGITYTYIRHRKLKDI